MAASTIWVITKLRVSSKRLSLKFIKKTKKQTNIRITYIQRCHCRLFFLSTHLLPLWFFSFVRERQLIDVDI